MSRRNLREIGAVLTDRVAVSGQTSLFRLEALLRAYPCGGILLLVCWWKSPCFINPVPFSISAMSDFHERFDIEIDMDEAHERFLNRVYNEIFSSWDKLDYSYRETRTPSILSQLGKKHSESNMITAYTQSRDLKDVLHTIEAIYEVDTYNRESIATKVEEILALSEIDIGIVWKEGKFFRKGAELLDDKLVNDPLDWLRTNGYSTVIKPFEQALSHFIEAGSRPELLSDVIGNSYKALEALAKIVVGNNSDLSTNKKPFVKRLNGNNFHEQIFKVLEKYLDAGNPYRHGDNLEKPLPELTHAETEFFLYLTGTFIRLAMENWESS